jgi:hypothetical protein
MPWMAKNIGDHSGSYSMQWLLGTAVDLQDFYEAFWEKKPYVVKRGCKNYYGALFDRGLLCSLVQTEQIQFGAGVTIAKHDPRKAGKQDHAANASDWHGELPPEEHPTGRVTSGKLDKLFATGHTAQVFATQKKSTEVKHLCEALEAELMSLVGCTAYLTPPKSQGIAPHHDDVEVFVLQTQGSKSWQLFTPQRELSHKYEKTPPGTLGKPMLEVTLEQGDLLYIPRGVIHQARATAEFSTHLTVSTYQAQSWGDLLEGALPAALERAMDESPDFRRGLPLRAFETLGTAAAVARAAAGTSRVCPAYDKARSVVQGLLGRLAEFVDVSEGVDAMHYDFMTRRMPCAEAEWEEEGAGGVKEVKSRGSMGKEVGRKRGRVGGGAGEAVTEEHFVSLVKPGHTAMLVRGVESDADEEEEEEDSEEEEEEEEEEASVVRRKGGEAAPRPRAVAPAIQTVRLGKDGHMMVVDVDDVPSSQGQKPNVKHSEPCSTAAAAAKGSVGGGCDGEARQPCLMLVTTRSNRREQHLVPLDELPPPHSVRLDMAAAPAVAALFATSAAAAAASGASVGRGCALGGDERASNPGMDKRKRHKKGAGAARGVAGRGAGGIRVGDLPLASAEERLGLVQELLDAGIARVWLQ